MICKGVFERDRRSLYDGEADSASMSLICRSGGWCIQKQNFAECMVIPSPDCWQIYLDSLSCI